MYRKYLKNEYYTKKARENNYPARSVYKLEEIDKKYNLIKAGDNVLDLGCAPGSWLLYLAGKTRHVVGIDNQKLKIEIPKNVLFVQKDVMEFELNESFDVIVSDLAPNTSGDHNVDVEKSLEFCERALEIAKTNLKKGGNFVCKIFEGEGTEDFFKKIKNRFEFAKKFKPQASRKESREIYIVGKNFKLS